MEKKFWDIATVLGIITVFYNIIEGLASLCFGIADESLSLFGFGLDSFIEVISGIGILHMIKRIKQNNNENIDKYESTALIITGLSFYLLTAGLAVTVIFNIIIEHKPQTTFWGIIISIISIMTMIILMRSKLNIGMKLKSDAVIADANCTKTCIYLSVILFISSILYQLFKIGYIDSIGAMGIAYYSFKEGRESMEKSKGNKCSCED